MLTRDIMTGSTLYTMAYTKTTSNGKLRSVTDSYGRKVSVMRDYRGNANAIQDSAGRKFELNINPDGHLRSFKGQSTVFKYEKMNVEKMYDGHVAPFLPPAAKGHEVNCMGRKKEGKEDFCSLVWVT